MKKENELIKSYDSMTDDEMWDLLAGLVDTAYFQAIQKFIRKKDTDATQVLATNDAFVAPTITARAQGIRQGIYMLEQSCVAEKKRMEEKNEEAK